MVAFPEVFLGLVPGWGGTQLLPNLIGIDPAVTVIVENALAQNKMTPAPKAAKLGIADAVLEPADFLERSLEWAVGVLGGEVTVDRPDVDRVGLGRGDRPGDGDRRRAHPQRLPRRGAGRRAARPGARRRRRRRVHRRHGGRGRRADRPAHERRAAGLALLVRPGQQAGQAAGRCAGQVAGPEGHQGRRRRRRADGLAAGAAVRAPAEGARRPDRHRPGARRQGRRPTCTASWTSSPPAAG